MNCIHVLCKLIWFQYVPEGLKRIIKQTFCQKNKKQTNDLHSNDEGGGGEEKETVI